MVFPSLVLKIALVTAGAGVVGSAIAVPTVLLSAPPWPVLSKFPKEHASKYRDTCRVLIKDETEGINKTKYLFVCNEGEGYGLAFYFYADGIGQDPDGVTTIEQKEDGEEKIELTINLTQRGTKANMIVTTPPWKKLLEKSLDGCSFINEEKSQPWIMQCPKKDNLENLKIKLTPVIIY